MRAKLRNRIERIERMVGAVQQASRPNDLVRILQEGRRKSRINPGLADPHDALRQRARALRQRLKTLLRIEEAQNKLNR